MKTRMKDIAEAAGVNSSTVSRALKGSPKVSTRKREEILRIAEEMGYRPDPMVRALMAQRRGKLDSHLGTVATVTLWPEGVPPGWSSIIMLTSGRGYGRDCSRTDMNAMPCDVTRHHSNAGDSSKSSVPVASRESSLRMRMNLLHVYPFLQRALRW